MSDAVLKPSSVCWAKVSRKGSFFPAMVVDMESIGDASLRSAVKKGVTLVRFFGTYEYSAVSNRNILPFMDQLDALKGKLKSKTGRLAMTQALRFQRTGDVPDQFLPEEEEEEQEEEEEEEEEQKEEGSERKRPREDEEEPVVVTRPLEPGDPGYLQWKRRKDKRQKLLRRMGLGAVNPALLQPKVNEYLRKVVQ